MGLKIRHGPQRYDAEHDCDPSEMRRAAQLGESPRLPEHGDDDRVEKQQMHRPFCQAGEAEKNERYRPRQPRRALLLPKCKPRHHGHPGERDVDALDLRARESRLRKQTELRHHEHRRDERDIRREHRPRPRAAHREHHATERQHGERGRQSRGPFIAAIQHFERARDHPVHQRRLAQKWLAADMRHEPIALVEHRHGGQNAPAFLALDFRGAEPRKIDRRPEQRDHQKCTEPRHGVLNTRACSAGIR